MCKIADWILCGLLMLCAINDLRKREIPVYLLILMSIGVLCHTFFCNSVNLSARFVGMLIGIVFLGISRLTKEAIGYGDSWIILILGIHMGGLLMLEVLLVASIISGIAALFCLWRKRWNKRATLPFVPFVALAYLGAIVL